MGNYKYLTMYILLVISSLGFGIFKLSKHSYILGTSSLFVAITLIGIGLIVAKNLHIQ